MIYFQIKEEVKKMELNRKHYSRLRLIMQTRYYEELVDAIDLELFHWKLVETNISTEARVFRPGVVLSDLGRQQLAAFSAKVKEERSPHHVLGSKLATYLRLENKRFTYENIEFSHIRGIDGGRIIVRPDVFSIVPTYNKSTIAPMVHEIKVSRSDFLVDIKKPEKRSTYSAVAEKVYYVAPKGMIKPEEIPLGYGFMEYEADLDRFETVIKAKKHKIEMNEEFYLNLVVKGYQRKE